MTASDMTKRISAGVLAAGTLAIGSIQLGRQLRAELVRRRLKSVQPKGQRFSEDLIVDLPEAAQRYFRHTIQPDTSLATSIKLQISAECKSHADGQLIHFTEERLVTPHHGGLWETHVTNSRLWYNMFAYYADGTGEEEISYWGVVPIPTLNTPLHVSRLFLERSMYEAIFVPSSLLPDQGVVWSAIDDEHACASIMVDGERLDLRMTIDQEGRLKLMEFDHWNMKGTGGKWQHIPSACEVYEEISVAGYTIPSHYRFSMWYNMPDRPNLYWDYRVEHASFGA